MEMFFSPFYYEVVMSNSGEESCCHIHKQQLTKSSKRHMQACLGDPTFLNVISGTTLLWFPG